MKAGPTAEVCVSADDADGDTREFEFRVDFDEDERTLDEAVMALRTQIAGRLADETVQDNDGRALSVRFLITQSHAMSKLEWTADKVPLCPQCVEKMVEPGLLQAWTSVGSSTSLRRPRCCATSSRTITPTGTRSRE
jgi:hypothetical protein